MVHDNKRIMVTGAGGYIGSVLVDKLLNAGYSVRAVDRFFFGEDKLNSNANLEIVKEDTRRLKSEHFIDIDAVIDLAAISNDPSAEMFADATMAINRDARIKTAKLAREANVSRYILPSSASVYGNQEGTMTEESHIQPQTAYSKSNAEAEHSILKLASDDFAVTVIRQATVFGLSPRMRFDLAINRMTYGCWKDKKLPLMQDGKQFRPMVHIQDTTDVMLLLLQSEKEKINGEIFNVGSDENNFQIEPLANQVIEIYKKKTGEPVEIEWYGDPDKRSYQLSFKKIRDTLNWQPKMTLDNGVVEILDALENNQLEKNSQTLTLEWYRQLEHWHKFIKQIEMYDGILNIK
jgi:nucleoside-diphosphate-sugar epimerase